jgi:hypothetical protein
MSRGSEEMLFGSAFLGPAFYEHQKIMKHIAPKVNPVSYQKPFSAIVRILAGEWCHMAPFTRNAS